MFEAGRPTNDVLPFINACLNGAAAVFLMLGFVLIKRKNVAGHKKAMLSAFICSAAFLACYLFYHFNYASHKYHGSPILKPWYFGMLISHIFLAVVNLPFILRLLWLAFKSQDFQRHKKLARWVWPVWMYVSVTGVLIYLILYKF